MLKKEHNEMKITKRDAFTIMINFPSLLFLIVLFHSLLLLMLQKASEVLALIHLIRLFLLEQLHNLCYFLLCGCFPRCLQTFIQQSLYVSHSHFILHILQNSLCCFLHLHTFALALNHHLAD